MSVGLLVLTHGEIGQSICDTARQILGEIPLTTIVIALHANDDMDTIEKEINETIIELDEGHGVLILTDIFGATPSNLACRSSEQPVEVVAGLNLPMLVRVMNYPELGLEELREKAISGGQEGIISCKVDRTRYASQGN